MSGWRRLWVVFSILLGVPALMLGYESEKRLFAYVDQTEGETPDAFWKRAQIIPALKDCDWGSAEAPHAYGKTYRVECDNRNRYIASIRWAFLPALLMALIGLTCRWIYRGFRPAK